MMMIHSYFVSMICKHNVFFCRVCLTIRNEFLSRQNPHTAQNDTMTTFNNNDHYNEAPLKSISTEPIALRNYKGYKDPCVVVYTQDPLLEDHELDAERLRARQANFHSSIAVPRASFHTSAISCQVYTSSPEPEKLQKYLWQYSPIRRTNSKFHYLAFETLQVSEYRKPVISESQEPVSVPILWQQFLRICSHHKQPRSMFSTLSQW